MGKRKEAWMEDGRRRQRRSARLLERGRDRAEDTSDRNPRRCKVADHPPRRCEVSKAPLRRCQVSKATFVTARPLRHCRISAVSRIRNHQSSLHRNEEPFSSLGSSTYGEKGNPDEQELERCDPNKAILKVYMYDLPPEFHFGLLGWEQKTGSMWPDLHDRVPEQLTMDHPFEGGEVPNISDAVDESDEEE
ncbi:hypothetical protein ACLOJK_007715 [Asimina triloba]